MNLRFALSGAVLLAVFAAIDAPQTQAADKPGREKIRILMVTQSSGFRHGPVTRKEGQPCLAEKVMTDLAEASKGLFTVDTTQDVANDFTREALDNHDILFFYTTGVLPIKEDVKDYAFKEWIKQKGHGFIGTHSAADTYKDYEPYWEMLGGTFDGHPWTNNSTVTVNVHDTQHPVCKPWGEEFVIKDEIYCFKHWQPEKVRVLMSLNLSRSGLPNAYLKRPQPEQVPIAWVKNYGDGRVFHMSLGHREDVWTNTIYQQSLVNGIKWVAGLMPGDATPNPELSAAEDAKAKKAVEAANADNQGKDKEVVKEKGKGKGKDKAKDKPAG